jgi:hypothetical protein
MTLPTETILLFSVTVNGVERSCKRRYIIFLRKIQNDGIDSINGRIWSEVSRS